MSKLLKVLLIAGHGAGDPGACSNYGTEANENRRVLDLVKSHFVNYPVQVAIYPTNRNAYADIGNGVCQVNFAEYDYVFEIHFNSSSNDTANGVEIWVTPAEVGITVEQTILKKVVALGFKDRGVKREDFRVIRTAKNAGTSAALVETCFISNQADMNRYNSNINEVCKAIVEGIAEGFGIVKTDNKPVAPPTPPTTSKPTINYYVKTKEGKQLGAFNSLDYAKKMASDNKAIVYDVNGKIIISYVPAVVEDKIIKEYAEKGYGIPRCKVNVRNKPSTIGNDPVASYVKNERINSYDKVVVSESYTWISYVSTSGVRRYVAVKDNKTGERFVDCY